MKKLGIGLVGLGFPSISHGAGFSEMPDACQVVAMCDIKEDVVKVRAKKANAKPYLRYIDLLDDPAVDVVDVTTQHESHFEIAKAALERRKHVFVEKPICVSSEMGLELVELAKKTGSNAGCGGKHSLCARLPCRREDPQGENSWGYLVCAHDDRR